MSQIEETTINSANMPVVVGWRILVEPIRVKEMSDGGIALPESVLEAKEYLRYVGRVVGMGSLCYKHKKFEGGEPWCKIGDWIAYGQYAGQIIKIRDESGEMMDLKLLNDDEVMCTLPNPEAVLIYA